MNTTTEEKTLTTADLAAAADRRQSQSQEQTMRRDPQDPAMDARNDSVAERAAGAGTLQDEQLAPLFMPQMAQDFRARWDEVQIGFVDDPTQAVRKADELVAQVMKSLAETFSNERANFEGQVDRDDTEQLRVALRRYRSFFQRLLSL